MSDTLKVALAAMLILVTGGTAAAYSVAAAEQDKVVIAPTAPGIPMPYSGQ